MIATLLIIATVQSQNGGGSYRHETAPLVQAAPLSESIVIDGVLAEDDWLRAPPATHFTQLDPREGEPASERTEVRVLIGPDGVLKT